MIGHATPELWHQTSSKLESAPFSLQLSQMLEINKKRSELQTELVDHCRLAVSTLSTNQARIGYSTLELQHQTSWQA
jgi:hypothetical protein